MNYVYYRPKSFRKENSGKSNTYSTQILSHYSTDSNNEIKEASNTPPLPRGNCGAGASCVWFLTNSMRALSPLYAYRWFHKGNLDTDHLHALWFIVWFMFLGTEKQCIQIVTLMFFDVIEIITSCQPSERGTHSGKSQRTVGVCLLSAATEWTDRVTLV